MTWKQEVLDHINHLMDGYGVEFSSLDDFVHFAESKLGHGDQTILDFKRAMTEVDAKLQPESR